MKTKPIVSQEFALSNPHPSKIHLNENGEIDENWYNEFLKSKGVLRDGKKG